jgi:hypothetical protein
VPKISSGNKFTFWVPNQPVPGSVEELFDLLRPDPVVLVVVEHWKEYVEMSEKAFQRHLG